MGTVDSVQRTWIYIYIERKKTIQNTFFLSPQKQYILSEIFRRCLQGNKSKEHCQGLLLSLSIAHVKQAACMLPPHVSRMPFRQDTHAYICQQQILRQHKYLDIVSCYCRLSLVLTTCRLYILQQDSPLYVFQLQNSQHYYMKIRAYEDIWYI